MTLYFISVENQTINISLAFKNRRFHLFFSPEKQLWKLRKFFSSLLFFFSRLVNKIHRFSITQKYKHKDVIQCLLFMEQNKPPILFVFMSFDFLNLVTSVLYSFHLPNGFLFFIYIFYFHFYRGWYVIFNFLCSALKSCLLSTSLLLKVMFT